MIIYCSLLKYAVLEESQFLVHDANVHLVFSEPILMNYIDLLGNVVCSQWKKINKCMVCVSSTFCVTTRELDKDI